MSEELVDELAQRFLEIYGRVSQLDPMSGSSVLGFISESAEESFKLMARECLRQMEWIRSECYDCVGGAAEDTGDRINDLKLTLAPPDWKPS